MKSIKLSLEQYYMNVALGLGCDMVSLKCKLIIFVIYEKAFSSEPNNVILDL